jgi:hypothetical protein
MKKQNGINKLAFNKAAVTELNDNHLNGVYAGTGVSCGIAISISVYLAVKAVQEYMEQQQQ